MRKLIVSLPFLLYYCIAPVSYDKAGINKGLNYYAGANAFVQEGEYPTTTCGYTSYTKYKAVGGEVGTGLYYGFNKKLAIGMEGAFSGTAYSEDSLQTEFLTWGYANLFLKFSLPISSSRLGLKLGVSAPYISYFNLSFGFPENEKFTISYTNLYLYIHSLNINYAISEKVVFSLGIYGYQSSSTDYARGVFTGIGLRK